jgi:hypothetical protein
LSIIIDNLIPARTEASFDPSFDMTAAEKSDGDSQARRRAAMAVLAGCAAADIADHLGAIAVPAYRELPAARLASATRWAATAARRG